MHLVKSLLASAALVASFGAQAVVTGSLGGGFGPFVPLNSEAPGTQCSTAPEPSNDCTLGPLATPIATVSGGTIYLNDMMFADDVAPGVPFLAAGPSSGTPSVMTFGPGVSYLSFLWGSPDTYNLLTITDNLGATFNFTTGSLGFPVQNGDQSFNQYVQFFASAGTLISSLTFTSSIDAFETTNYSVTPIPEPETYALMLAGLAALGFVGRRRKQA